MEGWAERVSELKAEMSRYEMAHSVMLQDVNNKDERIMVLLLCDTFIRVTLNFSNTTGPLNKDTPEELRLRAPFPLKDCVIQRI